MHRWNGCICGKDTAGFFLHGDRREEITDKKYSAQFLNPDALSLMFLWGCHFTHTSWIITACLHCVHKLYQKDLISKAFMRGRVSRWGQVEGGTVDYETSVAHLAGTVTSFVKWRLTSDLCTSDERGNTPFPKWKWTGGTKWAKHTLKFWGSSQWWNETSRKSF